MTISESEDVIATSVHLFLMETSYFKEDVGKNWQGRSHGSYS